MRYGMAGAHSNGKTTQLFPVAEALDLLPLSEVVRAVAAEWGITSVADVPDRTRFQWEVLNRQMSRENVAGTFFSDRTTVDNAGYFLRYVAPDLSPEEVQRYLATAYEHAKTYDAIVYFPIMWESIEDDGFRGTDANERREIDHLIRQLLTEWELWGKVVMVTKDDHVHGEGAREAEILEKLRLKEVCDA